MKKVILLFVFTSGMLFYGCATTGNSSETSYRANLGTATQPDIVRIIPNMFSRYNFTIYRQEVTGDGIWFESEWKERDLFNDESVMGASDVRTRITVTARSRTAQASSLHRVNLEIENHLRVEDEDGNEYWDRSTITEEATVYFRDIERTIRNELASGIRRN